MRHAIPVSLVVFAGLFVSACTPGAKTPAPKQTGFFDEFNVKPSTLNATSGGSFCSLVPGTTLHFRDGDTIRAITVLAETHVVDGVTTRVFEQRERDSKGPTEVSREFLAGDPRTGDVYCFGREVDIYEKGVIASHLGSWKAGVDGARFGRKMMGQPKIGEMYYQGIAPGVAMDRAEVVSVSETVETPAGVFEKCLHVRESSALFPESRHKWYAKGVGLIKDDKMVLVKVER